MELVALVNTVLKGRNQPSSVLPNEPKYKQNCLAGTKYLITDYKTVKDHWLVTLKTPIDGENQWWVYSPHFKLEPQPELLTSVRLDVPYHSQLNNQAAEPWRMCNVTSIAMTLNYFGLFKDRSSQLEDQLWRWMVNKGLSPFSPQDLNYTAKAWGSKGNRFNPQATWRQLKLHLSGGNPCVLHAWFTRSGHIVTVVGFDDTKEELICHDPFGVWQVGTVHYNTQVSGAFVRYPYSALRRIGCNDGDFWLHFCKKE